MCFIRTKESKVLVAKRGIKVYKIGAYADERYREKSKAFEELEKALKELEG